MAMTKIENETQFEEALKRVEYLMLNTPDDLPAEDPQMTELIRLGNLVADYDEANHSLGDPSLIDMIELRMYEMGLTQAALAKLIGVSPSRISDYLSGKSEPTLKVGRLLSQKLDIDPAIVLGV